MDEKRKAWCEKYEVKIADGGFIDAFCGLPEHVTPILTSDGSKPAYYVGFDGRNKTYDELTEEEKAVLTDACKIFLFKNQPIKLVPGDTFNIKITTLSDYKIASAIVGGNLID